MPGEREDEDDKVREEGGQGRGGGEGGDGGGGGGRKSDRDEEKEDRSRVGPQERDDTNERAKNGDDYLMHVDTMVDELPKMLEILNEYRLKNSREVESVRKAWSSRFHGMRAHPSPRLKSLWWQC